MSIRVLIAGWFSFEQMGATAGDFFARDLLCDWLKGASIPFEIAVAKAFFRWR